MKALVLVSVLLLAVAVRAETKEQYAAAVKCAQQFHVAGDRFGGTYNQIIGENVVVPDLISNKGFFVYNPGGAYFFRDPKIPPPTDRAPVLTGSTSFPGGGELRTVEFRRAKSEVGFRYSVSVSSRSGSLEPETRDLGDETTIPNLYKFIQYRARAVVDLLRSKPGRIDFIQKRRNETWAQIAELQTKINAEID
ncbi:MAG: hypothetical protein ABL958_22000, partial [Bdellovibrionia bacterium]